VVAPWSLLALLAAPLAHAPAAAVRSGVVGRGLVPVLQGTGKLQLAYGVLLGVGFALSG
jgi:1,4-dihydroxy-2-naphthoate polyprenyltransferase